MSIINLLFPINVASELNRPQVVERGGRRLRAHSGKPLNGASTLTFHPTNGAQPVVRCSQHQLEIHQKPQDDDTQDPISCPSMPRRSGDSNTSPPRCSTPQPVCKSDQHQSRSFDLFLDSLNMTRSERDLLEELSREPETSRQPHDPAHPSSTLDQAVDDFFDALDADESGLCSTSRMTSQRHERGSAVRATRLTREDFLAMESLFASSSMPGL